MPVVIGWHPWFRRVLAEGTEPVSLAFRAGTMLVRGADGIPTGERVPPTAGPWDDAFTDLAADPVLEWPGQLRLSVASTCSWWVVYSMPEHAICVEPQSGPPDGLGPSLRASARRRDPGPADDALHALVVDAPGLTAILG